MIWVPMFIHFLGLSPIISPCYSIHMYPSSECWSFVLELGIPTAWLFFLCCLNFCNDISSENRRHPQGDEFFGPYMDMQDCWNTERMFFVSVFFWLTIRYDIISSVSGIYIDGFSRHKVGHGFWFIAMRLVLRIIRRTKSFWGWSIMYININKKN